MTYNIYKFLFAFLIVSAFACSNDSILDQMETIKTVGNEEPQKALCMLDSIENEVRDGNEYVRNKFDLLRIRLQDKADILPISDLKIRRLIEYFDNKGTIAEKQEVYYYAGSIYRDLKDTPRALENFFLSLDFANENGCDSIMMRNTYSNLQYLQYRVQNYADAVRMAKEELRLCKQLRLDTVLPYLHLGISYLALDSTLQAKEAFDIVLEKIKHSRDIERYNGYLIYLLCDYSELGDMERANECHRIIERYPLGELSPFACLAFAQYFASSGKQDSAVYYCQRILDDGTDIYNMYDAAKLLYRLSNDAGDSRGMLRYSELFIKMSDSLDLGKRQELAAKVNNEYQYHLDQQKEQRMKEESERYRILLIVICLTIVLLCSLIYAVYVKRRNKHLKEILDLSLELKKMTDNEKQLENMLRVQKLQLEEKMEQNKTIIKMLHQSELECSAEDVVYAVLQSSNGRKNMKPADWKQLYQAVDALYPSFKDLLLKNIGSFSEQQMQVCYLMRIGMSPKQIQGITNLSRVTVWRWTKKFDWVFTSDESNKVVNETTNTHPNENV